MKIVAHTAISLAAGGILYKVTGSLSVFLWVLIIGIFVDIDHCLDYVRERGLTLNLKKVYFTCKYGEHCFRKLTIFLHSYELMLMLWVVVFMLDLDIVWKCAALSFSLHLFLDQLANPVVPFAYFFSFRMAKSFEAKKIFTTKEVTDAHWDR